jgi:hypothetical protein
MKLHTKSNTHSNITALRTEALALTYYERTGHPETKEDLDWAAPDTYFGTTKLTPSSGEIKDAIDEIISISESEGHAVTNHVAYCQFYLQSSTEPAIHYDWSTGFEPDFKPTHVAILWLHPVDNVLEFYEVYDEGITEEVTLSQNDLVLFNHEHAHRVKPATYGTDKNDSGLMLAVFMN